MARGADVKCPRCTARMNVENWACGLCGSFKDELTPEFCTAFILGGSQAVLDLELPISDDLRWWLHATIANHTNGKHPMLASYRTD